MNALLTCSLLILLRCQGLMSISPGMLLDMFTDIYEATGTFPDDKDEYTQLAIVNGHFNACLAIGGRKVGNGGRVELHNCYFTHIDTPELFWLRHAGQGYITLSTPWNKCVGAGLRDGAPLWTGDWCDDPSHQFLMVFREDGVLFQNKESGFFLTAVSPSQPVRTYRSNLNETQLWRVCDPSGRKCWPSSDDDKVNKTAILEVESLLKK